MIPRPDRRYRYAARLRLATGLVLFGYVLTHFINHALGIVSLETADRGREVFMAVWRSPPATLALYGSLAVHLALALWSLYRRRSLRMPGWEAAQLLLGLAIPPLLIGHVIGTRIAHALAFTDASYAFVLFNLWVRDPSLGLQQAIVFALAWFHGCMGLHFWLRFRPWYSAWLPFFYSAALVVPVLGMLGFVQAGREVAELAANPAWLERLMLAALPPGPNTAANLGDIKYGFLTGYAMAIGGVLLARIARDNLMRRRAVVIRYPGDRRIAVPPGTSILEASRLAGVPHASVGGRGRCSTCRVRVAAGIESLPPANEQERVVLDRIAAPPSVRLACQTRPVMPVSVSPLLLPVDGLRDARRRPSFVQGHERQVAVLFADIRGFTQMTERMLPYDVVFLLNRYFTAMGQAIESVDGRIDKFIGDGLMAVFGIAGTPEDACRRALAAARAMSESLTLLNRSLDADGIGPLRIGIGIDAGPAIVGEIGYGGAMSATAIGDTVNTASRLEALTKEHACQLIVSDTVVDHAGVELSPESRRTATIRGRAEPLAIHVFGDAQALPPVQISSSR